MLALPGAGPIVIPSASRPLLTQVQLTADLACPAGATTEAAFTTVVANAGHYSASLPKRLTCPRAGRYQFLFNGYLFALNGAKSSTVTILVKNAAGTVLFGYYWLARVEGDVDGDSPIYSAASIVANHQAAAGDYAEVTVFTRAGGGNPQLGGVASTFSVAEG